MPTPTHYITIAWSEEDGAHIAHAPQLRGCSAHGDTAEEARANILAAMAEWLKSAGAMGWKIPPVEGFYIVNCFDRPEEALIAQEIGGRLWYIAPKFKDYLKGVGFDMDRATPLEDFGLEIEIRNDRLIGKLVRESVAVYHDGKPRQWQGSKTFDVPYHRPKPRKAH